MSSSLIWGKPDDHTSMKYPDQSGGFVEPASFVTSHHWSFAEDVKEGILESTNGYSNHIAPAVHGPEEEQEHHDDFSDGEYGEIEITVKFRGRAGSSVTSRKLKLTSNPNSTLNPSFPTVLKLEQPTDDFPQPHRIYSAQENRSVCIVDQDSGCACSEFSPSILRELLRQTIDPAGLAIDLSFDNQYGCAISDYPSDEVVSQRARKPSTSSGKKRLLSNASDEQQPNKKNPRLAAPIEGAEENDGEDNGERHTCPYFKMYPERHLECGTKDLAQRPKIKSHIIKDHLKKSGIPIPPEIKSQKCEPWDRWCKWIVHDSDKTDRPVPNSTPDFYPILNYIVTAASEIPSDGLTCFSSVILRLFKSVQASPNDWVPFITGLEELERSLNVTTPILSSAAPRRGQPLPKEEDDDDKIAMALETEGPTANCDTDGLVIKLDTSIPSHCSDLSLAQYPTSATSTTADSLAHPPSTYELPQHTSTFQNIPEHGPIVLGDFSDPNTHMFTNPDYEAMSMSAWFNFGGMSEPTHQDATPTLEPDFYEPPPPPPPQPREEIAETPPMDHLPVPPGIGTNSKSLVRAAAPPRVRKRKHGTVRTHRIEGAPLSDSPPSTHTHEVHVSTPTQLEKYEFVGQFSVTDFLEWLRCKFDWHFDGTDGRKLHCRDVREDIAISKPDAIMAHLSSWSTKGVFVQTPEFWLHTSSPRTLGMDKYSMFTPALVEMIQDGGFELDNMSLLLNSRPGSSSYR
ncbi:hypothetical protein TWF730_001799 [Orbilia blumenaviensis]|uniref:Uncharacterized protein n=1 Tax=Orbilia blumenaviensis TaxID=1796055 RepID=A0AAV9UD32_9PEZI